MTMIQNFTGVEPEPPLPWRTTLVLFIPNTEWIPARGSNPDLTGALRR